jgi:hypothetical protein
VTDKEEKTKYPRMEDDKPDRHSWMLTKWASDSTEDTGYVLGGKSEVFL